MEQQLPIIDISPLLGGSKEDINATAKLIYNACTTHGFFYIIDHGVSQELQERLYKLSDQFFSLDLEKKSKIKMEIAGRAWRGFFPVGDEFTSGKPDIKGGLYLGTDDPDDHPQVLKQTPMFGKNLYPDDDVPGLKEAIKQYLSALINLGHAIMRGISLSLGQESDYFYQNYMTNPIVLFRIFHYPPQTPEHEKQCLWGVGQHTDHGILTILRQDDVGGLQVKTGGTWIEAPPIPNSFVCNIGDMLDQLTGGLFQSTPHRVQNNSSRQRYSFPFFFDPGLDAKLIPINEPSKEDQDERWDKASVHQFSGTYGEYLLAKVAKVFPDLSEKALKGASAY